MIYQNPQLLYALSAIAIPIIIHLFNLRKHRVIYFSSIRFLKEIKDENRRKSRIRDILILISRILAIVFLVLAFAKPYIPDSNIKSTNQIFIYIDNSQSMDIDFGQGNLLNIAKKKAIEIIESYSSEKEFYLITNDFESKNTLKYNRDAIKLHIKNIKSSKTARSIKSIISRANSINSRSSHLYFISDFQENSLKIDEIKENKIKNRISLMPITKIQTTNINIDTLLTTPILISDNEVEIKVVVSNQSSNNIENEILFLYIDNQQKSQQYINLEPYEKKEIKFQFSNNSNRFINGEIRTQDIPVTFDNSLFFILSKTQKFNLTIINHDNDNIAFNALFKSDTSLFNYISLKQKNVNHKFLLKQDFIILNEVTQIGSGLANTLLSFVNNGGRLLVVPPKNLIDFNQYNILLKSLKINTIATKYNNKLKINQFSTKHPIYNNVFTEELSKTDFPVSKQNFILNTNIVSTQIIGLANKEDFLSEYKLGNGTIYQFSSPIQKEFNNFTKHALFVPTLINIATSSNIENMPYYIIGTNQKISTKNINYSNEMLRIQGENCEIIPTISNQNGQQLLNYHNQITKNGFYDILKDNQTIDRIAFNYNTSEAITSSLTEKEIKDHISENKLKNISIISTSYTEIRNTIKEEEKGKEYWQILIILSLIFFALEILLIKLIKI